MNRRELLRWFGAVVLMPTLYFALGFGFHVLGGAIDQPHPLYVDGGDWFTKRFDRSIQTGVLLAILIGVLIPIDLIAQHLRRGASPKDLAYFPRPGGIVRCLWVMRARLTLVAGFLLLVGYFVGTELELQLHKMGAGGLVWPPERVLFTCLVAWGLLWIADCLARPDNGTVVAAMGFLLMSLLCSPGYYGAILRE